MSIRSTFTHRRLVSGTMLRRWRVFVQGYAVLGSMTSFRVPPVKAQSGTAYLAVCGPISADNQLIVQAASVCPYGAAACVVQDG